MKHIYTFLLIFYSSIIFAQTPVCQQPDNFRNKAFEALRNLDKNQIPSGALYELVYPMANIPDFTGTSGTDTSNTGHFIQAWDELYTATYNNTGKKYFLDLIADVEAIPQKKYNHPFGIIDYNYSTIKPDAVTSNLLSNNNGVLYDVPNRPSSPYISQNAAIASILTSDEYPCLYAGLHTLVFKSAYVLSNTGFNLNDVTFLEIKLNNIVAYSNTVVGVENLSIPLQIPNNIIAQTLETTIVIGNITKKYYTQICQNITEPISNCRGADAINIKGYAYDGGYNKGYHSENGVANIYWADTNCANKVLKKVVIFVDGFDATNEQHHENIWKNYLNKRFRENNQDKFLGNELLANGYDVIILDQVSTAKYNSGGGGLIENNGLVLAKLLDTLYSLHSTTLTQDFIVVGASMGGLVTRFGLAWMEANNKPHHTGLFISFDSPQNGANIPVGVQHLINNYTQNGIKTLSPKTRNSSHYSNAAKQLLLHHTDTQSETTQAHPLRAQWLANVAAVGDYPKLCRNVSIINGNIFGYKKEVITTQDDIPIVEKDKYLDFGIKRNITLGCSNNACFVIRGQLFAQSAIGRYKTHDFAMNFLLNPLFGTLLTGTVPFIPVVKYHQPENGTSYDVAPGSRLGINPFEKYEGQGFANWINLSYGILTGAASGKFAIVTNNVPLLTFIPTYSAVGYIPQPQEPRNIYKNFSSVILNRCSGNTVFDTVYAYNRDMFHVDIDANIAGAFRNEVNNLKPRSICAGECPDYISRNSPLLNSPITLNAAKAITLLPNFKVDNGKVFKAQIGCVNSNVVTTPLPNQTANNPLPDPCPLEWNTAYNSTVCNIGFRVYNLFVKNIEQDDYAEFSTDGNNWTRANFGNKGHSITFVGTSTNSQTFYAKSHNKPNNVILINIDPCP